MRSAADNGNCLRFDAFVEIALYHPAFGYYQRDSSRVGRSETSDFYTAGSIHPLFPKLVVEACSQLLGSDAHHHTFVEIGAEPDDSLLREVRHPFADTRTLRIGDSQNLSGPCVVFSNELFDAQPFRRFVCHGGGWQERFVRIHPDGNLSEELRPIDAVDIGLPLHCNEGYQLDLPTGARSLCRQIVDQPWHGLFLAFDYGLSWNELCSLRPQGTARAYKRHRQHSDLLENPGEQDITLHICWDHLETILESAGFYPVKMQTQESFFMHHSSGLIGGILTDQAGRFATQRQSLKELIHPQHLGRKFQVLHGLRPEPAQSDG